ncbi:hypothetical protein DFP72DRAFT_853823 [Ephemerocybe angulata]|uniref:Uncharacterized protein n=1 Tax=Ephemerocybe angulata TaxID=980116 RepID=A0A8H6HL35_9AGAR|nr:hypothetical protein DFP72DRAFT_853823 [Tulosesus angulatus]
MGLLGLALILYASGSSGDVQVLDCIGEDTRMILSDAKERFWDDAHILEVQARSKSSALRSKGTIALSYLGVLHLEVSTNVGGPPLSHVAGVGLASTGTYSSGASANLGSSLYESILGNNTRAEGQAYERDSDDTEIIDEEVAAAAHRIKRPCNHNGVLLCRTALAQRSGVVSENSQAVNGSGIGKGGDKGIAGGEEQEDMDVDPQGQPAPGSMVIFNRRAGIPETISLSSNASQMFLKLWTIAKDYFSSEYSLLHTDITKLIKSAPSHPSLSPNREMHPGFVLALCYHHNKAERKLTMMTFVGAIEFFVNVQKLVREAHTGRKSTLFRGLVRNEFRGCEMSIDNLGYYYNLGSKCCYLASAGGSLSLFLFSDTLFDMLKYDSHPILRLSLSLGAHISVNKKISQIREFIK